MKIQFTLLFCFIAFTTLSSQTTLSGSLTDAKTGESLMYADVIVYKNGRLLTGTTTDWTGEYYLDKLDSGIYDIVFSYVGYEKNKVSSLKLNADENNYLDETLSQGVTLNMVVVIGYETHRRCGGRGCCCCIVRDNEVLKTELNVGVKYPELKVYPNPASSHFTIKSEREINDASIFNLSGQLVKTLNKGQTEVDVSDLIAGTYFLVITDDAIVQTEKIVIVRD